jgi:endonuclease/exonuclease/phosphatase family metal-dependent hydrolase
MRGVSQARRSTLDGSLDGSPGRVRPIGKTGRVVSVARTWTVTTWNVHGAARPPIASIAARLRALPSDVIALQEVRSAQAAALANALGMQHHWSLKHYPWTPLMKAKAEGAAILTPHSLESAGSESLPPAPSRWTYRHRIVLWALVRRADRSAYRVYNVHLTSGGDQAERLRQAQHVAALVTAHGGAPAIVAGDLNDASAAIVDALPGSEGPATAPTNPAGEPTQRIDHVLVPDGATEISVSVPAGGDEWAALSDHLPVTTTFSLDWVEGDFPIP